MDNLNKKETVLEAFLRQSNIKKDCFSQTEEYEKIIIEEEKKQSMKMFLEQTKGAFSYRPISENVNIPTKLTEKDINQKTESSSQFKNYDHSLEEARWKKIGGKSIDDGIAMEDIN